MMKNLLAPYEQRPWAQTNWILVRLWRVSILHSLLLSPSGAGWTLSISVSSTTKSQLASSSKIFPYLFYQGCGFGYRYTRLPHLLKTKPEDASLPSLQSEWGQALAFGIVMGGGPASSLAAVSATDQACWVDGC